MDCLTVGSLSCQLPCRLFSRTDPAQSTKHYPPRRSTLFSSPARARVAACGRPAPAKGNRFPPRLQAHLRQGAARTGNSDRRVRSMTAHVAAVAAADAVHLGIDFGTSGARATAVTPTGDILAETRHVYSGTDPTERPRMWQEALEAVIRELPAAVRAAVVSVAVDGTSATAMLVDPSTGACHPAAPPLMYNEACAAALPLVEAIAPEGHTVRSSTSTLCKLVSWHQAGLLEDKVGGRARYQLQHQADWVAGLLHGRPGVTDYNNALKLGYDPAPECAGWPHWLVSQPFARALPEEVVPPGAPVGSVSATAAARFGLPRSAVVCGGTTDSIAAFLAAGVDQVGQGVTSLGSTLAIKLLSDTRVDQSANGIYSHRLGQQWLVGGASNVGGTVLRELFSNDQLRELSDRMDPSAPTGLEYYPLPQPGERFPVNDPQKQPCLEPRPADDAVFLQGVFESMARIEGEAYAMLGELGASQVTEVYTAGGGAANDKWIQMRQLALGVPVKASDQVEASYGAALLARTGFRMHSEQASDAI